MMCSGCCRYRGSPLSTIFGIWKKPYYAKFVLVSTTQPISTSTVYSTQKFHQYGFQYIALKNRTSGNRTTGDRTSRGPPVYGNFVSINIEPAKMSQPRTWCNERLILNRLQLFCACLGICSNAPEKSFLALLYRKLVTPDF